MLAGHQCVIMHAGDYIVNQEDQSDMRKGNVVSRVP